MRIISSMKARAASHRLAFVFACVLGGPFFGCSQPDSPAPVKPTEAPPAPSDAAVKPHETTEGKAYGSNDMYKKMMRKPGG